MTPKGPDCVLRVGKPIRPSTLRRYASMTARTPIATGDAQAIDATLHGLPPFLGMSLRGGRGVSRNHHHNAGRGTRRPTRTKHGPRKPPESVPALLIASRPSTPSPTIGAPVPSSSARWPCDASRGSVPLPPVATGQRTAALGTAASPSVRSHVAELRIRRPRSEPMPTPPPCPEFRPRLPRTEPHDAGDGAT